MNPLLQLRSSGLIDKSSAAIRSRMLWRIAAAALAVLVVYVIPTGRIRMGANQLNGLVGSYQYGGGGGHGNWRVDISYSGNITTTSIFSSGFVGHYLLNSATLPINSTTDISTLSLGGLSTTSGGIKLDVQGNVGVASGSSGIAEAQMSSSDCKVNFTLTWLPSDPLDPLDAAPATVYVYYRGTGGCGANAVAPASLDWSTIYGVGTCGGTASASISATGPGANNSDPFHSVRESTWLTSASGPGE